MALHQPVLDNQLAALLDLPCIWDDNEALRALLLVYEQMQAALRKEVPPMSRSAYFLSRFLLASNAKGSPFLSFILSSSSNSLLYLIPIFFVGSRYYLTLLTPNRKFDRVWKLKVLADKRVQQLKDRSQLGKLVHARRDLVHS